MWSIQGTWVGMLCMCLAFHSIAHAKSCYMHSHMLTVSCMICKHSTSGAPCKIIPVSDITSGVCPLATHICQVLLCPRFCLTALEKTRKVILRKLCVWYVWCHRDIISSVVMPQVFTVVLSSVCELKMQERDDLASQEDTQNYQAFQWHQCWHCITCEILPDFPSKAVRVGWKACIWGCL